ncbi:MAG: phage head closure protein [Phycisphaerae bacterium]|nr:phage head closure protein [Phycisphaerae bacterium]
MNPGKLRHRLVLSKRTFTQDAAGEQHATWATQATVWGSVEPLSGRELLVAQELQANVSHRVRIRGYGTTEITPDWRVTHLTRTLEIASVIDPEERGAEYEFLCAEKVT